LSDDDDLSSTTSRPLDERLVGVVIGGTVVAILLLLGGVLFCILRRRYGRKKYVACGTAAVMCRVPSGFPPAPADVAGRPRPLPTSVANGGKLLSNGIVYNGVECDDAEVRYQCPNQFGKRPHRRPVTCRRCACIRPILTPSNTWFLAPIRVSPSPSPKRHLDRFSRFLPTTSV